MAAKLIAKIQEPKVPTAEWIVCVTDEIFDSPYSPDHGKPIYITKDVFYTDLTHQTVGWETKWSSHGYREMVELLKGMGLDDAKIAKILDG